MGRKWKTQAERKKRYKEVLEKAERSKARIKAAQTRPSVSKKPKVQAKKPDFKKMEPIAELPKKPAQDTENSYGMSLLRASEVSDNARLRRAFGPKTGRERLDEPAREALCGTVVQASEPVEPSSTGRRTDSVLKAEIRRIEEEMYFDATGETPKTDGKTKKSSTFKKNAYRLLLVYNVVTWSCIIAALGYSLYRNIDTIFEVNRDAPVIRKDSDFIVNTK